MNSAPVFTTERLLVRRWQTSDAQKILALYSNPSVVKWIDDGQPISPGETTQWMSVTQKNYVLREYGMFAVDDRQSLETLGFGGLVHPGGQSDAEVKYAFDPKAWGQGIATEFVKGLLDYGKNTHDLKRIIATIAPENAASRAVLLKSGFTVSHVRDEADGTKTEVLTFSPDGVN